MGDGQSDDAPAIQALVSSLVSNAVAGTDLNTLYFPPGLYMLGAPIVVGPYGDFAFLKLELRGAGKHNTKFQAVSYPSLDLFQFVNSGSHYISALTIRDLHFGPCCRALTVSNATYCEILDCAFMGNGWNRSVYGIEFPGNSMVTLRGCWFYHTGNILWAENGSIRMEGCRVGEDAGNIWVHGSLTLSSCEWIGGECYDRNSPTGYLNMGPGALIVEGGSRLLATGCAFQVSGAGRSLLTLDLPISVIVTGNDVVLRDGAALITSRRLWAPTGASITNNFIWARGTGGTIWAIVQGYVPNSSVVRDNRIKIDPGARLDLDSQFRVASAGNVVRDNLGENGWR